jgi:hypothetical protein
MRRAQHQIGSPQLDHRGLRRGEARDHHLGDPPPARTYRVTDRGQRRLGKATEREVVVADHGEIEPDLAAEIAGRAHGPHGEAVVGTEDRRDASVGAQGLQHHPMALVLHRVGALSQVDLRAGCGRHLAETRRALDGVVVGARRAQHHEPAMAETDQQLAGETAADHVVALEAVEIERARPPAVGDERKAEAAQERDALASDARARDHHDVHTPARDQPAIGCEFVLARLCGADHQIEARGSQPLAQPGPRNRRRRQPQPGRELLQSHCNLPFVHEAKIVLDVNKEVLEDMVRAFCHSCRPAIRASSKGYRCACLGKNPERMCGATSCRCDASEPPATPQKVSIWNWLTATSERSPDARPAALPAHLVNQFTA